MLMKEWRDREKLSFRKAAIALGLKSESTVFEIEAGKIFPEPATVIQIESATKAQVGLYDHMCAWKRAHHEAFTKARDAGRIAAKAHSDAAKKEATHGKTRKRQRQEP